MSTRPSLGVSGATRVPPSTAGTSSGGGDLLFGTDTEFGGIPSPMRTAGGGGGGGGSAGAAAGGADPLLEFSNDLDYGRRVGAQGAQLDATRYLCVLVRVCCQSSCLAWPGLLANQSYWHWHPPSSPPPCLPFPASSALPASVDAASVFVCFLLRLLSYPCLFCVVPVLGAALVCGRNLLLHWVGCCRF